MHREQLGPPLAPRLLGYRPELAREQQAVPEGARDIHIGEHEGHRARLELPQDLPQPDEVQIVLHALADGLGDDGEQGQRADLTLQPPRGGLLLPNSPLPPTGHAQDRQRPHRRMTEANREHRRLTDIPLDVVLQVRGRDQPHEPLGRQFDLRRQVQGQGVVAVGDLKLDTEFLARCLHQRLAPRLVQPPAIGGVNEELHVAQGIARGLDDHRLAARPGVEGVGFLDEVLNDLIGARLVDMVLLGEPCPQFLGLIEEPPEHLASEAGDLVAELE